MFVKVVEGIHGIYPSFRNPSNAGYKKTNTVSNNLVCRQRKIIFLHEFQFVLLKHFSLQVSAAQVNLGLLILELGSSVHGDNSSVIAHGESHRETSVDSIKHLEEIKSRLLFFFFQEIPSLRCPLGKKKI